MSFFFLSFFLYSMRGFLFSGLFSWVVGGGGLFLRVSESWKGCLNLGIPSSRGGLKNVASRAKTHLGKPTFFFSSLTCILRVILTYFERFKDTRSRNKSNNAYTHTSMLKYVSAFVSEPSRKMGRNKPKFFVVNGIFLPTFLSIGCILNPASSSSHTSSYCNRPKQTNKRSGFMYTSRVITFLSSSCAIVWLFNGTKHFT